MIVSNTACLRGDGGGILVGRTYKTSRLMLVNCLIAGNEALDNSYGGGGIHHYRNSLDLVNCTIVSNWSDAGAGGIERVGSMAGSNKDHIYYHTMLNNIVYHNSSSKVNDDIRFGAGNRPAFTNNCIGTSTDLNQYGSGNFSDDPKLIDVEGGNYRLAADSPCLNGGFNEPWMSGTLDLDRKPRIDRLSQTVDMGCYERELQGTFLFVR